MHPQIKSAVGVGHCGDFDKPWARDHYRTRTAGAKVAELGKGRIGTMAHAEIVSVYDYVFKSTVSHHSGLQAGSWPIFK